MNKISFLSLIFFIVLSQTPIYGINERNYWQQNLVDFLPTGKINTDGKMENLTFIKEDNVVSLAYDFGAEGSWGFIIKEFTDVWDLTQLKEIDLTVNISKPPLKIHFDFGEVPDKYYFRTTFNCRVMGEKKYILPITQFVQNGETSLNQVKFIKITVERTDFNAPVKGNLIITNLELIPYTKSELRAGVIFRYDSATQKQLNTKFIYTTDLYDRPIPAGWYHLNNTTLVLVPPLATAVKLNFMWHIPGYGKVMVSADNTGQGYTVTEDEQSVPDKILVNELAKTKINILKNRIKKCELENIKLSDKTYKLFKLATDNFTSLPITGKEKKFDLNELQKKGNLVLGNAALALESCILDEAQYGIEKYKKGIFTIKVVKSDGTLIKANIDYKQEDHHFLFGSNFFFYADPPTEQHTRFAELNFRLFNFATLPFFHGAVQPHLRNVPGEPDLATRYKYDFSESQASLKYLTPHGIVTKGHPLIWINDDLPTWMRTLDFLTLKTELYKHVHYCVTQFKYQIQVWDVINEAHDWANIMKLDHYQIADLTRIAMHALKSANPSAKGIVNACLPDGLYLKWFNNFSLNIPYDYYIDLEKYNVDYDILGLQVYTGFAPEFPLRDIPDMSFLFDKYSRFGKPIHITEFAVPSKGNESGTLYDETMTPETQAEYAEKFYTLCMGKEKVAALTWFGLFDNEIPNDSGIYTLDREPKPVYFRLQKLLNSWLTSGEGTSDINGTFKFNGFYGKYKITVKDTDGKQKTVETEFIPDRENIVTIKM